MGWFAYYGYAPSGDPVRGVVSAQDEQAAEELLEFRGIDIESLRPSYNPVRWLDRNGPSEKEVLDFFIQMKNLVSAGIPVVDALEDTVEGMANDARMKPIAEHILFDLKNGETLAASFSRHTRVFSPVFVSIISVGEESGRLEEALEQIVRMLNWSISLKRRAKKATIQPALSLAVALVMAVVMITVVAPRVLPLIEDMGGEKNFATISLQATSSFIFNYGLYIVAFMIAVTILIATAVKRNEDVAIKASWILLRIPVIGDIIKKIKISILTSNIASMLESGITFVDALKRSTPSVNNAWMESVLKEVLSEIEGGSPISTAFSGHGILSRSAERILRSGEESGQLDSALRTISNLADRDANTAIDMLEPLIQPAIIFLVVGLIGWIILAIMGPVYDTFSNIRFAG